MELVLVVCVLLLIAYLASTVESTTHERAARPALGEDRVELSPAAQALARLARQGYRVAVFVEVRAVRQGAEVPALGGRKAPAPGGSGCLKPLACGKDRLNGSDGDSLRCSDASF
jgi:hypothetical protein